LNLSAEYRSGATGPDASIAGWMSRTSRPRRPSPIADSPLSGGVCGSGRRGLRPLREGTSASAGGVPRRPGRRRVRGGDGGIPIRTRTLRDFVRSAARSASHRVPSCGFLSQ